MRHAVINELTGFVVNVVMWDGESEWYPGQDLIAVPSDTLGVGDECELVEDNWVKKG